MIMYIEQSSSNYRSNSWFLKDTLQYAMKCNQTGVADLYLSEKSNSYYSYFYDSLPRPMVGAYTIKVLEKRDVRDAYEPDSTPALAFPFAAGDTPATHTLEANDTDYVSFTTDSGKTDTIFMKSLSQSTVGWLLMDDSITDGGVIYYSGILDTVLLPGNGHKRYLKFFSDPYYGVFTFMKRLSRTDSGENSDIPIYQIWRRKGN